MQRRFATQQIDRAGALGHYGGAVLSQLARIHGLPAERIEAGWSLNAEGAPKVAAAEIDHVAWQQSRLLGKAEVALECVRLGTETTLGIVMPRSVDIAAQLTHVAMLEFIACNAGASKEFLTIDRN